MSLIDDFAKGNLGQSIRDRFVPLSGGGAPKPESARADALSPMRTPPTPSQGVFNAPGQAEIPTLTHPLRDPQMNTQPGNALARATGHTGEVGHVMDRQARLAANGSLATPGNEIKLPGEAGRGAFSAQPGQGLADAARTARPPSAGPAIPDPANATRAAFNTQPGQAFAEASGMTNPPPGGPDPFQQRMAQQAAQSRAAAGPTGVQAGSLDDAMRAATLRNGAQPGEALAARIANGAPQGAVGVGGGAGGAGIPPGGAVPGAAGGGNGGGGWYNRFTNAASDAMRPNLPTLGAKGNGLIGKAAAATLGAGAAIAKKAAPWVAPVVEGVDVATVALDPNSSKADVVEQAGTGALRVSSAIGGATLGTAAGAMTGPAAPIAAPLLGIAGGIGGYMLGDAGIRQMREWMGLPSALPAERAQARAQVPQMAAKIDTANKSVANDAAADKIMNDPTGASQQALIDAFKPQGKQAPAAAPAAAPAQAGGAPAPAPTQAGAPAPAAPQQGGSAMQLAALQAQQEQSPIAFTTMGGGQAPQVFYKDGSMGTLQAGQQMPADVAEFNARHQQINALMNGQPAPGAAPAAPAAPQGAPQGSQMAGYVPFSHIGDANLRRNLQIFGGATAMAEGGDYDTIVGGKQKVSDFSKHPGIVGVTTKDGPSTAAGRYQITGTTWGDVSKQKNLADFSPKNQDDAFIALLERRGALADVTAGNFDAAVAKLGNEWQGLPSGASKNQGKRTPAQFAKMLADATAQADKYGAAPAQAAAAPAPMTGSGALSMQQPVHMIKGLEQFTAMPTGGPAMQPIPQSIVDAGRQAGNVQGAVKDYMGNVIQGANIRANPTAGKLAEEAVKGEYQNQQQRIAGQYQNEGQRISGVAQNESSRIAADASRDVAKVGADNQRYMTTGGGVNPDTMMPNPQGVFDKRAGAPVDTTPKAFPKAPPAVMDFLAANAHDPVYVQSFIKHFGNDAYQKFLKNGK